MSKILITGNGFDLFHHLPTKYGHFMAIMKTIEEFGFAKEISFDELFRKYFKDEFSSDYILIKENYNTENIKFDLVKIKELDELLKTNNWYNYFKTVLEIDTWIDFEVEVENILSQLLILLKAGTPLIRKNNTYRDVPISYSDFNLFGITEHKFDDKEIISVSEKYLDKRKFHVKNVQILSDLSISFESFIIIFNQYLVTIVSVFYDNKVLNKNVPFHLMSEIYTFNYTPTLEKIYKIDKSKIIYLHGKMHEDSNSQNLVFGINEITQEFKKAKAYDFTKYYQKIKKNSNEKFVKIPAEKTSNLKQTIFYIIGHSLDESDREYISDLFKFMEHDLDAYSKICIFYHSVNDRENKLKNLLNIIDKKVVIEMNKVGRLYFTELNYEKIVEEFNAELVVKIDPFDIR